MQTDDRDSDASRRAYYKEFVKVVELSDVVIQVLDARDPLACRAPEVERFVRKTNPGKRVILLLNKIDLVPKSNVEVCFPSSFLVFFFFFVFLRGGDEENI